MFEPKGTPTILGMCAEEWEALLGYGVTTGFTASTFAIPECPPECVNEKHYYRFGFVLGKVAKVVGLVILIRFGGEAVSYVTGGVI